MNNLHKTFAASATLLLLILLSAYTGIRYNNTLDADIMVTHDHLVPKLQYLEQMRFGVLRIVSSTSEFIVLHQEEDDSRAQAELAKALAAELNFIQEGKVHFRRSVDRIKQLQQPAPAYPALLIQIDEINEKVNDLIAIAEHIVSAIETGAGIERIKDSGTEKSLRGR